MIAESRAIHGSRSSREFQTSASRPPGRSTRAISGSASSWSNQWNACAEVTTSADASGSGIASALPATRVTRPGAPPASSRAHLVERLDRRHAVAERDERARELPRARAEVDDVARLVADEPADGLLRIARTSALVRTRHVRERRVRPAHLRIAVDDHRVESRRPRPCRLDQAGDPRRRQRRSRRRRRASRRAAERRRGRSRARRTGCRPRARVRSP